MRKVVSLLLCTLLLLSITACQLSERTPTDELKFLRVAEELSLTTSDSTDAYYGVVDVEKTAYATDASGRLTIEFLRCADLSEADRFYQYMVNMAENTESSGISSYNRVNLGKNYSRYHRVVDGTRFRIVRIENTVLYAVYEEAHIPIVRELCEKLGYE